MQSLFEKAYWHGLVLGAVAVQNDEPVPNLSDDSTYHNVRELAEAGEWFPGVEVDNAVWSGLCDAWEEGVAAGVVQELKSDE